MNSDDDNTKLEENSLVLNVKNILALDKKDKLNSEQINIIVSFLKSFPSLLSYINNDMYQQSFLRDIALNLRYRKVNKGEIFIQQNEKFHNYYLIIQGGFSLYSKKSQEQYNQELNWFKVYTNTMQLLNSEQSDSLNPLQIQKLKEQIQKSEGFLKVLQTPFEDQKLLLPHLEFYKHNQKICMYKSVNQEIKQYQCLGDVYDINLTSNHLMIANEDTDIAYLPQESYTKLFQQSIQQLSFISRTLEKLLSNGINKNEIHKMSRLFKEKVIQGSIFKEQEESKEIYIIKKGIIVIKKGSFKVGEVTQGKIFGHENALSEQDRTISAQTKDHSLCTLYSVNVFDLCEVVSLELLKTLMKQGRKKLEQYQEVCFKFHHVTDSSQNNNMKMYKVNKEDNSSAASQISNMMNPQISAKHTRSQSSHIQGRNHKYNSFYNNQQPREIINPFSIVNNTRLREQQSTLKSFEKSKSIQEKSSPKSTQTAVSCIPNQSFQTTHQIQTSGLIITMGAANQNYQTQLQQQTQNTLQNNYFSLIEGEQNSLEDGLEQIQSQYNSNKSDYQMQRFYSQTAKKVQTSGLNNTDQRKVLSRKLIEQRENSSTSGKVAQTDQSWFVIKRLNTPSKIKKTQTDFNSRISSNMFSPSQNMLQTQNSKDPTSFSNLMSLMTKNNTTEEQESPLKQRATLTSFIKQKSGQNGQTIFSSVTKQLNNTNQSIKPNNEAYILLQQHNQMRDSIKNYIESKTKQDDERKENEEQQNEEQNQIDTAPGAAIHSIGSQDEEEDRLDFNLQSRYSAKKNLIQQSRYQSHQQQVQQNIIANYNSEGGQTSSVNMPIDINEYSSVNSRNSNYYNNNKYNRQLTNKNINQGFEKNEIIPQTIFQKRPSSNLGYVKPRYEGQNQQYTKFQIMNAQQIILKQFPTKINIVSQSNVQNFDDLCQQSRKSTPQLFNNTMLNKKLESSENSSRKSQLQQQNSEDKSQKSPSAQQSIQEGSNSRRISFGSLQNASGLIQLKRSLLQSPEIYKVSDFIHENQFQDDQFSKSRDSEGQRSKESTRNQTKNQTPLIQYNATNAKIKLRTNSCHTAGAGRAAQSQNSNRQISKAAN